MIGFDSLLCDLCLCLIIMSQDDHTDLVNQVVGICDIDESTAKSYLEAFNWDLNVGILFLILLCIFEF